VFASLPAANGTWVNSYQTGQVLLRQPMNPPIFPNFVSKILRFFFERIASEELDNLRNLGQRRLHPVLLPKIYRDVGNIKLEGKLALGELQIEPSSFNVIAPRSANIGVFLPVNRFLGL